MEIKFKIFWTLVLLGFFIFLIPSNSIGHDPVPQSKGDAIIIDYGVVESDLAINISKECENTQSGFTYVDEIVVFCITSEIDRKTVERLKSQDSVPEFLYINSWGGDVLAAMEIGLYLHPSDFKLIVERHCHSSCANYIIPAAAYVYVMDNTAISMHGGIPRDPTKIALGYLKEHTNDELSDLQNYFNTPGKHEEVVKEYFDKYIAKEVEYFSSITIDESYLTRYWEVERTFERRTVTHCYEGELFLMLTHDYFDEFIINIIRSWEPKNRADYAKMMKGVGVEKYISVGFDEYPVWHHKIGNLTENKCKMKNSIKFSDILSWD